MIEVYIYFGGTYCPHLQGRGENLGSYFALLAVYILLHVCSAYSTTIK
jgi:hypothetical protein